MNKEKILSRFSHYEPCPRCRSKGNDNRGDNFAMYSDGGSHCFSCGLHQFPKHYVAPSKKEIKANGTALLPPDFSREVPGVAWKWLLQYGLPYSYWQPQVGWTEKDSRLVFVEDKFSIGRFIERSDKPIERSEMAMAPEGRKPRKWFVWGNSHQTPIVRGTYSEAKEIVLVEDCISAHKIAVSGIPAISLYGTRVFDSCVPALRHIGLPVVFWLDKDQEGTMPRKCDQLRAITGLDTRYIITDTDPKTYSADNIKEILK